MLSILNPSSWEVRQLCHIYPVREELSSMWHPWLHGVPRPGGQHSTGAFKAGVVNFTNTFAGEVASKHIRVVSILPGVYADTSGPGDDCRR